MTKPEEQLEAALAAAANEQLRTELLAHATTEGFCDAEYCPWAWHSPSLCMRSQTHHLNCRCADCAELWDNDDDN